MALAGSSASSCVYGYKVRTPSSASTPQPVQESMAGCDLDDCVLRPLATSLKFHLLHPGSFILQRSHVLGASGHWAAFIPDFLGQLKAVNCFA